MIDRTRLGPKWPAAIAGLWALTVGMGLGSSGRLTYHEAFVARPAAEMIAGGDPLIPTVDGLPWLEKPPLAVWLVALSGRISGGVVTEWAARAPSALASLALALGLANLAARRFGPTVGGLAGLIQVTTAWTIMRGRLAEADIVLAALVAWAMVALDRLRMGEAGSGDAPEAPGPAPAWRWAFFGLLGLTSLVKGVGFGAALVISAALAVGLWDRDRSLLKGALTARGWALAAALALAWPALAAWRHPEALRLWTLHVSDRLASHPEHFIGGPWYQYGPAILLQALPWTPLALVGAWPSLRRAIRTRGGGDRLLWAWAVVPVLVLSAATVKNAHYAIHALPPWSAWAALGLVRVGARLEARGWAAGRVRRLGVAGFGGIGLACALAYLVAAPGLDRRGLEWDDCRAIGRGLDPATPLAFLYEGWDRKPYYTPFGPVPHDWAVRLYYLGRPASWRQGVDDLAARPPSPGPYALLARDRDLPALGRLGRVEATRRFPSTRFDRAFTLFRITPGARVAMSPR